MGSALHYVLAQFYIVVVRAGLCVLSMSTLLSVTVRYGGV